MQKYTEEHLVKVNSQIARIKQDTEKFSRLKSQDALEFWNAFKAIMKFDIEENKRRVHEMLQSGEEASLSQLRLIEGFILCGEKYIDLVDKSDDFINMAATHIGELKKKAAEIQKNIDLQ